MYTLYITWPALNLYYIMDNITILLLSVVSQWVVMTESLSSKEYSHLMLIVMQCVCDNISVMSSDVSVG